MFSVFGRRAGRPASLPIRNAHIECLESRRFLSASLQVTNLDVLPGSERMIFNKIKNPNPTIPNYVKDTGKLQLTNAGNTSLTLSGLTFSGPFKLVGSLPTSIAAGKSVTLTVQFTATSVPKTTYNQTSGTTSVGLAGTWIGSMTFKTNDPAHTTYKEELAGWYQTDSEKNEEPNLVTLVNLIGNFKTNVAPAGTVVLSEPDTAPKYYGEEIKSMYWSVNNAAKPVSLRQLASWHKVGDVTTADWFKKSDKAVRNVFSIDGSASQSFLPFKKGQKGVPGYGTFLPGAGTVFGFHISNEYSDDALNTKRTGGGHHIRFYPLRDHNGALVPNTYLMTMDYSKVGVGKTQNYDFQDEVFIIANVKPAGN
jgi:hypothetical protein